MGPQGHSHTWVTGQSPLLLTDSTQCPQAEEAAHVRLAGMFSRSLGGIEKSSDVRG